ncbi:unnamed protein product, partial [Bubo scandiacus]
MAGENQTHVMEFMLLSFPHGQPFIFVLFLAIYLATLLGNSAILALVFLDPHLHSPMYFFISHLSCLDICYSSVTVPKILANALCPQATISYGGCLAQMFFLMGCAGAECALLAVMAYDRYAAICQPLRYAHTMSRGVCVAAAAGCWLWGMLDSAVHTLLASRLSFCGAARLQHIFCDVPPAAEGCLQQHPPQRSGTPCCQCLRGPQPLPACCRLLPPHPGHHPRDARGRRPEQGLLHLLCPPARGCPVLCDGQPELQPTQLWLLPGSRHAGLRTVLHSHPHAEPPHLQPPQPGGAGGPAEGCAGMGQAGLPRRQCV